MVQEGPAHEIQEGSGPGLAKQLGGFESWFLLNVENPQLEGRLQRGFPCLNLKSFEPSSLLTERAKAPKRRRLLLVAPAL